MKIVAIPLKTVYKDIEANLILDEGCTFETDDPKPLVKIINYVSNKNHCISNTASAITANFSPINNNIIYIIV